MSRREATLQDLDIAEKALANRVDELAGADPHRDIEYQVILVAVEDIRECLARQTRSGRHPWKLSHGGTHYTEAQGRA